jgi:hypothetical protein
MVMVTQPKFRHNPAHINTYSRGNYKDILWGEKGRCRFIIDLNVVRKTSYEEIEQVGKHALGTTSSNRDPLSNSKFASLVHILPQATMQGAQLSRTSWTIFLRVWSRLYHPSNTPWMDIDIARLYPAHDYGSGSTSQILACLIPSSNLAVPYTPLSKSQPFSATRSW